MRQSPVSDTRTLIPLLLLGVLARLAVAKLGYNYDLGSWRIAADLMLAGKNIYTNDVRYNYGPVWACILFGLGAIQQKTGFSSMRGFHLLVAGFLSLVDVAVALLLQARYGRRSAFFFFFNPVMILLTGFHSQIDTLALMFGLAGWLILERSSQRRALALSLVAGVLVGISLSTKHILIFFPFWVLFSPSLGAFAQRALFALTSLAVFIASFLPALTSHAALVGIYRNVVNYNGGFGGLTPDLVNILLPVSAIATKLNPATHEIVTIQFFKLLFVLTMLATGYWMRFRRREMFALYLIAFFVFATAVADQYLAIPIIGCAVYHRRRAAWFYCLFATLILLTSNNNIAKYFTSLHPFAVVFHYEQAQFCLLFLLLPTLTGHQLINDEDKKTAVRGRASQTAVGGERD